MIIPSSNVSIGFSYYAEKDRGNFDLGYTDADYFTHLTVKGIYKGSINDLNAVSFYARLKNKETGEIIKLNDQGNGDISFSARPSNRDVGDHSEIINGLEYFGSFGGRNGDISFETNTRIQKELLDKIKINPEDYDLEIYQVYLSNSDVNSTV